MKNVEKELEYFLESISGLDKKILALLIQLPPSLGLSEGIEGEVKNTGATGIKFAQIIATVYDANNQTVGTGMTFTTPTDIPPGQSAPFDLMLQPGDLIGAANIKLHLDFREG